MAQTIQFIPCDDTIAGGSLKGSIFATYHELETMFGEPAFCGKGDKITTEFCIDYEVNDDEEGYDTGTFALYDWHYARNFGDDFEKITWNVGGKNFNDSLAADLALKLFTKSGESLVYAKWHDVTEEDELFL